MKINITMKTSDAVYEAAKQYANRMAEDKNNEQEINTKYYGDKRYYIQTQYELFEQLANKWFEYGECVTLEIDTEEETCKVV